MDASGPEASDAQAQREREPRVGTVADEAARLVELLASRPTWTDPVRRPGPETGPTTDRAGADDPMGETGPDGSRPGARGECTCGGRAPACQVCPVCQLISFASQISPETFDRAADLIDFAATALRDLATARRDERDASSSSDDGPDPAEPTP
ncbi:MAG: hypothetical protein ABIZ07_12540 [Dermatophilaceae bacterium]